MLDDSIRIFKCLSDKSRIQIINNLLKEPMYVELLSERLGLAASTVSFHLKKLEAAKLVRTQKEQYYVVYHLNNEILDTTLSRLVSVEDSEVASQEKRQKDYNKKIVKTFFEYGKLKSIPVQRKKRAVILNKIAEVFEQNKEYSEKEVNILISDFHDDFCTLRREMIAEKILSRDKNIYKLVQSKHN